MTSFTPIAICADDYAQNAGIDDGILNLLQKERLTAVSCFATSPRWNEMAPLLKTHAEKTDIGLHFNLTEGFGVQDVPGLRSVIVRSVLRGMKLPEMRKLFNQQLDTFEEGMSCAPSFIDGHQHVHQLPGVRQAMLQVLQKRYPEQSIWVRNTVPADLTWRGKPQILRMLGGQVTADNLHYVDVPTNDGFAGVYGFDRPDYDVCFRDWLAAARPGMLMMCHPATSAHAHDAIADQRLVEYAFLQSNACVDALKQANVDLVKLSDYLLRTRAGTAATEAAATA